MTELYTSLEDPATMARFYDEPKVHPMKTKLAREKDPDAEPVYVPQTMIEIHIKGSAEVMRRPMQERDKSKFAAAWSAYEGDEIEADGGTPLSALKDMDDVTIKQYSQKGIKCVEDLAAISDNIVSQLGRGSIMHKKAAAAYLKNHNDATNRTDVLRRIEAMDQAIAALTRNQGDAPSVATDSLEARIEALEMAIADIGGQLQLLLDAAPETPTGKAKKKDTLKLKEAESDAA